jgi:hypothetical protein
MCFLVETRQSHGGVQLRWANSLRMRNRTPCKWNTTRATGCLIAFHCLYCRSAASMKASHCPLSLSPVTFSSAVLNSLSHFLADFCEARGCVASGWPKGRTEMSSRCLNTKWNRDIVKRYCKPATMRGFHHQTTRISISPVGMIQHTHTIQ